MKTSLSKIYRRLLYLRREMIAYFWYYARRSTAAQIRVVIFAQGRTGSTLLESLISATGHFEKYGELLNTVRGEILFPSRFIRGLSKRYPRKNFIFHVKVYQLTRDRRRSVDPSGFLESLYNEGWKIIYLKRRNKVKHVLSNVVAEARGAYHKFDQKNEQFTVDIDTQKFIERVEERYDFEKMEEDILQHVDFLQIVYDDDLEASENHQETVNKILDYLSLERRHVSTPLKKVNTTPLDKLITNYDEFEQAVNNQGWREYL